MENINVPAVAELARKAVGTEVQTIRVPREGDIPVLIVDKDRAVQPVDTLIKAFEKTQSGPFRRRGTFKAADITSFLAWMAANTDAAAPVFADGAEKLADWKTPKLALVGIGNYSDETTAAWHDFNARYDFPLSEQWKVWTAAHEKPMGQADFAEFIEDRIYDLSSPLPRETLSEAVNRFIEHTGGDKGASPAKIVELSRGLKVTANAKLEQQINLASGEATLSYHEEHVGAGSRPIKVPQLFYIRIPVFFGQPASLIGVRLRYRLAAGNVTWSYSLFAPEIVVATAFEAACEQIRKADRALYLGAPDRPE